MVVARHWCRVSSGRESPAEPTATAEHHLGDFVAAPGRTQPGADAGVGATVKVRSQRMIDEVLLRLTFDMNKQPHDASLGSRTAAELVLFQSCPRLYSVSQSTSFSDFSLSICVPPLTLFATSTSSGVKWSSNSDDCVERITCVLTAACFASDASIVIAYGWRPSSGSSTRMTDGRYSSGCRNSVASAMKRKVPSDSDDASKYASDSLCLQTSRILSGLRFCGARMKSSKNGATC